MTDMENRQEFEDWADLRKQKERADAVERKEMEDEV